MTEETIVLKNEEIIRRFKKLKEELKTSWRNVDDDFVIEHLLDYYQAEHYNEEYD